jgi:ABC-type multidrug transport system ATPase subunit
VGGARQPRVFMHHVGALIEGPAFYPTLSGRTNLSTVATLGRTGTRTSTDCYAPSGSPIAGAITSAPIHLG